MKWSELLAKKNVSEFVINESSQHLTSDLIESLANISIESKEDVKNLKATLKQTKKLLPSDIYQ